MTNEPEMVERVSQTLAGELLRRGFMAQLEDGLRRKADIEAIAHAAIEAMMAPTASMSKAGEIPGWDDVVSIGLSDAIWQAMILDALGRASLKEGEGQ